ncbi:MAG: ABC transporter permease [Brevinematales bacterium]|nr:ABC transporter permease [Brevinematales bacterium]
MRILTLLSLAFRNLTRQKRRNFFLGTGIALGMAMLVLAGAFSLGLKDLLIDRWITYMSGHIQITVLGSVNDFYGRGKGFFKDKAVVEHVLDSYTNEIDFYYTDASAFVRLIGNKRADLIQLIGMDVGEGFIDFLNVVEGNPWDLTNTNTYENPIVLTTDKAEYLRVKLHDSLRASFPTIHGQMQTARFTVVGLYKADVSYMGWVGYVPKSAMRRLLDYKDHEWGSIVVILKDKNKALPLATEIHQKLTPPHLVFRAKMQNTDVTVAGFWREEKRFHSLTQHITLIETEKDLNMRKQGIFVPVSLAKKANLSLGKPFTLTYKTRFEGIKTLSLTVSGLYTSETLPSDLLLINEKDFYALFQSLPAKETLLSLSNAEAFCTEWYLFPRPKSAQDINALYDSLKQNPIYADKILVSTLYESASTFLQFLSAINIVSLVFASFLFLIVMVGLTNSLRMVIRERSREIGTLRAIGMQQRDVRWLFLLEVGLLMLFSGLAGMILGSIAVFVISSLPMNEQGFIGMFLINKRLHLVIDWGWNLFCLAFVLVLGLLTASRPSKRASRMSPAEALVHYE